MKGSPNELNNVGRARDGTKSDQRPRAAHWGLGFNPLVLANDYLLDIDHPRYGPAKHVAPLVNLSKAPAKMQRLAPYLREHSLEILNELAYDDEATANLMADDIVGCGESLAKY